MTASPELGIEMKDIGSIKPWEDEDNKSNILAFYLHQEEGYGFFMQENGAFTLFEYDSTEEMFFNRVSNLEIHRTFNLADSPAIISWHYNYETRMFYFIDAEFKINTLLVNEDMEFSEDQNLNQAIGLGKEYK